MAGAIVGVALDGPEAVPVDYKVPNGGELVPVNVEAVIDGSGAGSDFYAVLQVIAPSGRSMGKFRTEKIAAGASADVTWFPGFVEQPQAAGGGIQYDTDNTGGWLYVETSSAGGPLGVGQAFVVDGNGGFVVNNNGNGGIALNDSGSGGIELSGSGSSRVTLFTVDGQLKLETNGFGNILLESTQGITLQDNASAGNGGITIDESAGNFVQVFGLPTVAPGASKALWNNGGVLNITP